MLSSMLMFIARLPVFGRAGLEVLFVRKFPRFVAFAGTEKDHRD
jgi:hypothetical protein